MKLRLWKMLKTGGALLAASSSAGELVAFTMPVPGVDRRHEQRAGLPLEDLLLVLPSRQTSVRPAALDHQEELVVHVPLGFEAPPAGHLQHEHALHVCEAVEIQVGAATAEPLPRPQLDLARVVDADATMTGMPSSSMKRS